MWGRGETQTPRITSISGARGKAWLHMAGQNTVSPHGPLAVVKQLGSVALPRKGATLTAEYWAALSSRGQGAETPYLAISRGRRRSAPLALCGGKSRAPGLPPGSAFHQRRGPG